MYRLYFTTEANILTGDQVVFNMALNPIEL